MSSPLSCPCGHVTGTLHTSERDSNRIVCYCDDCQAFCRHLGRGELLDPHGGTDLTQVSVAAIRLDDPTKLAVLRLTGLGMHRWYCPACKAPLANTLGPRGPYAGLHTSFHAPKRPIDDRVQVVDAYGDHGLSRFPRIRPMVRVLALLAGWWVRGDARKSPFFRDGRPIAVPTVLTNSELQAAKSR